MLLLLSFTDILFIYSCGNYKSWTYKTRYDDVECRRFETKTTLIHVYKIYIPWFLSIFINHTYAMLTTTSILFLEFDSIDRCFWSVIKRQESEILYHKHRFYTLFTFVKPTFLSLMFQCLRPLLSNVTWRNLWGLKNIFTSWLLQDKIRFKQKLTNMISFWSHFMSI